MERLSKFEQDDEFIVMDKLFEQLTNLNTGDGRLFCNINKVFSPKCDKIFTNSETIENEESYVPDVYNNEFDLFQQYFLNLKKSNQTQRIKKYIEKNFSNKHLSGCNLTGCSVFINQDTIFNTLTLPVIDTKTEVSSKIRFLTCADKVTKTVAVHKIKKGETIICEKAAVAVKSHNCICVNTMNYECNHCWKPVKTFYTCHTCQLAVYCSKTCCTEAQNDYHRWDCHAQKTHFFELCDYGHLALRILLCGVKCKFNLSENKYKMLYNLRYDLSLFSKADITKMLNKSLHIMAYLYKYTELFSYLEESRFMRKRTQLQKFIYLGSLLVRHYAQACIHAVFLPLEDYSYVLETRGVDFLNPAICLNTCNIRHSCTPNVFVNYRRNYCIVKALRDIEVGEEILMDVNRLDNFQNILSKRIILKQKQIKCNCTICSEENLWGYTDVLYKCPVCMGPMGRFIDYWKCFKCVYRGNDLEFNNKINLFYNLSSIIDSCRDSNIMAIYLNYSDNLMYSQMTKYYYVIIKLISMFLEKEEIINAIFYINKMMYKINIDFHRYSLLRIIVLSTAINYIIMYAALQKGRCAKSLIECCEWLMDNLEISSNYYEYSHQMHQLRVAFNKVIGPDIAARNIRYQFYDNADDCNDIESEESGKISAAYALLLLAKPRI